MISVTGRAVFQIRTSSIKPEKFSIVIAVYFAAQLIDIFLIIPLVVAKIVNFHPITVVIVIIIGAQMGGILGMIISIPVASMLKLIISTIYSHLVEFQD